MECSGVYTLVAKGWNSPENICPSDSLRNVCQRGHSGPCRSQQPWFPTLPFCCRKGGMGLHCTKGRSLKAQEVPEKSVKKRRPFCTAWSPGKDAGFAQGLQTLPAPTKGRAAPLPTAGQPGAMCRSSWAWNCGLGGLCRFPCHKSSQPCTGLFFLPV